jgi:carbamoylphosphate synthase large subunit
MPKRTDPQSILILGSGPIVIGQAAGYDDSGTKRPSAPCAGEGCRVTLVNSNPGRMQPSEAVAGARKRGRSQGAR